MMLGCDLQWMCVSVIDGDEFDDIILFEGEGVVTS